MKEFMPNTHIKGEDARAYAAGELSFDQIAEDRGPRFESTLDMYMSQIPAHGYQPGRERKLTKSERAALSKRNEDSIIFEQQIRQMQKASGEPSLDEDANARSPIPRTTFEAMDGATATPSLGTKL